MGLVIILISFFIQTGDVTIVPVVVSIPIAILVGAILLANNIRDLDSDQKHGRKTLAILVGRTNAIRILAGMFIISFTWMIGLVALHVVSPWTMLVFLSVPKAFVATKGFIGKTKPIEMMPAMKATAQTNTQFGFWLVIGILISHWL